jgi:hypothetical protein
MSPPPVPARGVTNRSRDAHYWAPLAQIRTYGIYLHYAFDLWAHRWRQREATGDMIILRYADDTIVSFEHETDACRFLDMMRARLEEFALSPRSALRLEPEKTRLIEFGRHAAADRDQRGLGKQEIFNFLGFTFICGKSRKGRFLIIRKTRRDRIPGPFPFTGLELLVFEHSRRHPLLDQPDDARVTDPMFNETDHPFLVDHVEKRSNVGV